MLKELGNPKHVIFEIATKHFRESHKQHLLSKGLRLVLACENTEGGRVFSIEAI